MLPKFDLLTPATLPEALDILAGRPDVLPLAGGTNVIVALREGGHPGCTLIDVGRLDELHGIRRENDHIVVGGAVTIAELLDSPLIAAHAPPLHQAARRFANPLVRNRATLAGNLVDASPAADTAPPLLALDAEVELVSMAGARCVPLDEFMLGVNQTARRPDELVRSVRWPVPAGRSAGGFYKLALRQGTACAVVSAAALVDGDDRTPASRNPEPDRSPELVRVLTTRRVRVALGAVAVRPIRVYAAEETLSAEGFTADAIAAAAAQAAEAAKPIDDVRSGATYRKRMAAVLVRRLLTQIAEELRL